MELFQSLCNGSLEKDKRTVYLEIRARIYEKYTKTGKSFFWLDLTKEELFDIFTLIVIEKNINELEETDTYFCVENISLLVKEKYRRNDDRKESFKSKMLKGDIKIINNVKNVILFNMNYKELVTYIMRKFLQDLDSCNVFKYYSEIEDGENVMYKEWYYPNYCIKRVRLGEEIKRNNNYIFSLLDEINFACQRIKRSI
tara:strand:- start:461 stop:1057 length:597 start_codon:yes stop_codon:yes gene_type:complete